MGRAPRTLFTLLLPLSLSLLLSIAPSAQDFRATITGRITDSNKAAIPNAQVTVRNIGTNETTTATTDSAGNYKAPLLRPGTYSVSVEVTGFKKAVRENVELVINQVATIDVALEPGSISEQVTVQGEAPLLESATADRGGVIDRQRVIELPLNARNPFMLGILTAGVNFNGASIWQRPFDNGAIAEWTINGSQSRGNEFLLDGAPNNGQAGGNNIAYVPPVDSVQDFKIMTNTYDAQYGKTTGGIINVNLRSGTNAFHGSIYEFMRRQWLDATDFRLNARGADKAQHYLDQYGVQLEGPVYIPGLFNGRDKTFFMVNYEGYREGVPQPLTLSVPTPEMMNGDFSGLADAAGNPITIYDPLSATEANNWARTPFKCDAAGNPIGGVPEGTPCNKIPRDRINPIAQRILSFYPKPNSVDPAAAYGRNNFFFAPNLATDAFYNYVVKLDHQFNERHRSYIRWANNDRTEDRNVNGITTGFGQDGQHPFKRINDAFVLDHLATFSPTFIFNFRTSFNRFIEEGNGIGNLGFDLTSLGFPSALVNSLPFEPRFGRYEVGDGYPALGRYAGSNVTNTVAMHPTFTWIRGSQTWRGGVDMRWTQYIQKNQGNVFRLTSGRNFTQRLWNEGDDLSGNGVATFLLGYVGGNIDYNLFSTTLGKYYAPWFQNDWKVSPKLTLNLGVRWDVNVAPNERYDRLNRGFDPNVTNPVDSIVNRSLLPYTSQLMGSLQFAGVNGLSRTPANIDWNNIQPRVGFAYMLKEKLVMRGGWGIYYVNPGNDYLQFAGFAVSTGVVNSLNGGRRPIGEGPNGVLGVLGNPFPDGFAIPQGSDGGEETYLGRGFDFVNPNFQVPYVHQFSFGFQYQLPWEAKIELSYVGNRTRKLQTNRAFNEPDLAMRQKCNPLEGGSPAFCNEGLTNPFKGLDPFQLTSRHISDTVSRWDLARPYPHFGGITEVGRNDGGINYDSMQVTFEKRARSGMNLVATYTFSKQIEAWGWNDQQRGIMQRGLYWADRPHRFTAGMVYQLPFGEGKKLFNIKHGLFGRLVSGWEATMITQIQSGRPWDLNENIMWLNQDAVIKDIQWKGSDQVWAFRTYPDKTNPSRRGVCSARINDNGQTVLMGYSANLDGCTLNNVDVIRKPSYSPRFTSFRHPSLRLHSPPSFDVSFNKMTNINERLKLQFRVEMFNFTNTYSYRSRQFTGDPNDRNFGSIFPRLAGDTEVTYPRHIQLAMKFTW